MRNVTLLTAVLVVLMGVSPVRGDLVKTDRFRAYADFRLRLESDFDSRTATGAEREDRTRMRVRARLGARFEPDEHWRFELRLRSGQEASQQSPHITIIDFDDNDTGDASFDLDRWYLRGTTGNFWASAGRDRAPIWKQNEELFDDDATFAGIALGGAHSIGTGKLSWSGGYYSSPVGMRSFSGNLGLMQLVFQTEPHDLSWTFALGGFRHEADPDDPDAPMLLQNNGLRDYSIVAGAVQARRELRGSPLKVGVDLLHNAEDYSADDPDPITAANHDQTDGFVIVASYGGLDAPRRWLVGYSYADVELFAVNSSYSQDDWVRWGSATQTRSSDRKGHELRFGWALHEQANLLARLYLVEGVSTPEDGNRFRVDFNYAF